MQLIDRKPPERPDYHLLSVAEDDWGVLVCCYCGKRWPFNKDMIISRYGCLKNPHEQKRDQGIPFRGTQSNVSKTD